jgi:hypothetical protein
MPSPGVLGACSLDCEQVKREIVLFHFRTLTTKL